MSFAVALLAPFSLLPAVSLGDESAQYDRTAAALDAWIADELPFDGPGFDAVTTIFRAESSWQVRIEQHTTIRIVPLPRPPVPPAVMAAPRPPVSSRLIERNIGRCVPAARISGVRVEGGRLKLLLSDRRLIGADLEHGCRARDFYSGFYLQQNGDGQLCAGRDTLQSRNGATCRLTRIRQLVDADR